MNHDDSMASLRSKNQTPQSNSISPERINPLRQFHTIQWFRQHKNTSNANYQNTLDQKQKIQEINQLFKKFDSNNSGSLSLDEIQDMFKLIGIEITIEEIQGMFIHKSHNDTNQQNGGSGQNNSSSQAKFKRRKMSLKEFQDAMMSQKSYQKFKEFIKKLRKGIRHNDYDKVSADTIFLPVDLGEMLNFLYRKTVQSQIKKKLVQSIQDTEASIIAKRLLINQKNMAQQQALNQDQQNTTTADLPKISELNLQQQNLDKNLKESLNQFNELFRGQIKIQDTENLYQKFQIPQDEIEFRKEEKCRRQTRVYQQLIKILDEKNKDNSSYYKNKEMISTSMTFGMAPSNQIKTYSRNDNNFNTFYSKSFAKDQASMHNNNYMRRSSMEKRESIYSSNQKPQSGINSKQQSFRQNQVHQSMEKYKSIIRQSQQQEPDQKKNQNSKQLEQKRYMKTNLRKSFFMPQNKNIQNIIDINEMKCIIQSEREMSRPHKSKYDQNLNYQNNSSIMNESQIYFTPNINEEKDLYQNRSNKMNRNKRFFNSFIGNKQSPLKHQYNQNSSINNSQIINETDMSQKSLVKYEEINQLNYQKKYLNNFKAINDKYGLKFKQNKESYSYAPASLEQMIDLKKAKNSLGTNINGSYFNQSGVSTNITREQDIQNMSYVGTKADLNSRNQSFMNQSPFTKASVNYRSIQEFNDKEEILWGLTQKQIQKRRVSKKDTNLDTFLERLSQKDIIAQ